MCKNSQLLTKSPLSNSSRDIDRICKHFLLFLLVVKLQHFCKKKSQNTTFYDLKIQVLVPFIMEWTSYLEHNKINRYHHEYADLFSFKCDHHNGQAYLTIFQACFDHYCSSRSMRFICNPSTYISRNYDFKITLPAKILTFKISFKTPQIVKFWSDGKLLFFEFLVQKKSF